MALSKMRVLVAVAAMAACSASAISIADADDFGLGIHDINIEDLSMCPVDLPKGVLPPGLSFSADVFRSWESFEHIRKTPWMWHYIRRLDGNPHQAQDFSSCKPDC